MVAFGVAGNAFKCVDATNADVQVVGVAELLDGFGVAVGHLALLGQLQRTVRGLLGQLDGPAGGFGVARCVVDGSQRNQSGDDGERSATYSVGRGREILLRQLGYVNVEVDGPSGAGAQNPDETSEK
ncbi:hypothetical protein [Nonomuraea sp. NPDC050783]|uniref:hypothetical protein n=1 Tax=Nonomuraea sp. NPDC050783 TaxID=3154634 RepID=UPI003466A6C3